MTKRTVSYDEDSIPTSSRDYNGNPSNLETAVVENYNSQNSRIKPAKRRGKNHSADIMRENGDDLALKAYLGEIHRYPPVSREEEIALAQRIADGDEYAKDRLVEANLRFVVSVAKQYQHMGLSLLELISEGNYGLIEAVERFDVNRGFKFISYAVWWIRNEIMKALTERSGRIDDSEQGKLIRDISAMQQRLGRDLTVYEIASELGLSIERLERRLFKKRTPVSMDRKNDNNTKLSDILQSSNLTPEEIYDEGERRGDISRILGVLSDRERKVIELYFGFDGYAEPLTLEKIGKMMGVTRARVGQIKGKGLKKIRESDCFQDFKE